ncbi:protein MLP1 homolog isoform X2 [Scaptodrosophila lebanonensis]|uniref:Protein MLP1 homolog isoform X2 n=1 Tax=Drosophila lebanonensis TaxID=7225 RepID=A0A6J2U318_DROLE|nr:protein MLP1 homolog isoform X2 [Scaptodrosophila lebanonensis]
MDLRSWKKVLLQWVSECSFIEKNYMSIEQTDLEGFFAVYVQNTQLAAHGPPQAHNGCNLQTFLRNIYPDFTPHYDNRGNVMTSDYLYVYTLLMHYACVRCPNEYFHSICKKLPNQIQQCIKGFFEQTVQLPEVPLTRDRLRQVIANVACLFRRSSISVSAAASVLEGSTNTISSTPHARPLRRFFRNKPNTSPTHSPAISTSPMTPRACRTSAGSDECANVSDISDTSAATSYFGAESPGEEFVTPVDTRAFVHTRSAEPPLTPKTELLEICHREVTGLKAQLETERYEKTMLLEQMKDNSSLIAALQLENENKQKHLNNMDDDGNESEAVRNYVPNDLEHLKNRMRKEIDTKDDIIAKIQDKLEDAILENSGLENKLKMSDKQMRVCMDRIRELEVRSEELAEAVAKKEKEIAGLESDKLDLEQCLQEMRDAMHSKREVLNASSDLLDASLSQGSMNTTPENLGSSVIDKQLREKEHENNQLREEIKSLLHSKQRMGEELCALIREQAQVFHLEIECDDMLEWGHNLEKEDSQLNHIVRYLKLLSASYQKEQYLVKELQDQSEGLSERNSQLVDHVELMTKNINAVQKELALVLQNNTNLERCKFELEQRIKQQDEGLQQINQNNEVLREKVKALTLELQQREQLSKEQALAQSHHQTRMEQQLEMANKKEHQLQERVTELQTKLTASKVEHDGEIRLLSAQQEQQRHDLAVLKEKHEKLLLKHEELRQCSSQTDNHLAQMRQNLDEKEHEMAELGREILELRTKNIELESRINSLMTERTIEMEASRVKLEQKELRISELEALLEKDRGVLRHVRNKYQSCKSQLYSHNQRIETMAKLVNGSNWDDVIAKVDTCVKAKHSLREQVDLLKNNNASQISVIEQLEKRLQAALDYQQSIEHSHEQQVQKLEMDVIAAQDAKNVVEERLEASRQRHNEFIQKIKADLKTRENTLKETLLDRERDHDQKQQELKHISECNSRLTAELELVREQAKKFSSEATEINNLFMLHIDRFYGTVNSLARGGVRPRSPAQASCHGRSDGDNSSRFSEHFDAQMRRLNDAEIMLDAVLTQKTMLISSLTEEKRGEQEKRNALEARHAADLKRSTAQIAELQSQINELSKQNAIIITENRHHNARVRHEHDQRELLISSLEKTAEKLQMALALKDAEVTASMRTASETMERLSQVEAKLKAECATSAELLQKLAQKMDQLDSQGDATADVLAKLTSFEENNNIDLDNSASQGVDFSNNTEQLRYKLDKFLQSFNRMHARYTEANLQIKQLMENQEDLQKKLSQQSVSSKELEEQLRSELTAQVSRLSNHNVHLDETVKNLEDVNEKLVKDAAKLEAVLGESQQALQESEAKQLRMGAELAQYQVEIASLESQVAQLQSQEAQLLERVEQEQDRCKAVALQLEEKVGEDMEATRLYELQTKILNETQDELQRVQGNLDVLQLTFDRKAQLMEDLSLSFEMQRMELEEELESKRKLIKQHEDLQAAHNDALNQLQSMSEAKSQAQNEISELQTQSYEMHQTTKDLEGQLERQREAAQQEQEKLKVELVQVRTELQNQVQNLENRLLTSNSEAATLRETANKSEQEVQMLRTELDLVTKNAESLNLKIVELQAQFDKNEREFTAQKASIEEKLANLIREKEILDDQIQKSSNTEMALLGKIGILEQNVITAEKLCKEAQLDKNVAHERITKLEQLRDRQEKIVRTLEHQLNDADDTKVSLNHDIGGLNSEIAQYKRRETEHTQKFDQLQKEFQQTQNDLCDVQQELLRSKAELDAQTQNYLKLSGERQQLDAQLQSLQESNAAAQAEQSVQLLTLNDNIKLQRVQIDALEKELKTERVKYQALQGEMLHKEEELRQVQNLLEQTVAEMNFQDMQQKDLLLEEFKREREEEKQRTLTHASEMVNLQKELQEYSLELATLRSTHDKLCQQMANKEVNDAKIQKLELDCQVLQAKYREAKEELARADQRLKDQRLELEGKLEKMKNKMKALYNEEITRMKQKQEREATTNNAELEAVKAQNAKYEEHVRKLSNQIVRLNDKILEHQKQHAILSTKLRHMQQQQEQQQLQFQLEHQSADIPFKRPSALPTSSGPAAVNLGTNLAMEDEEGEVFNNTYLTDLKMGRVPEITTEELHYRNSLQPPHLKSTYAAQYDLVAPDDDLKDGPHSLDDSMSALLSTTGGCAARKKSMGTHYKRPGPPTPSKNGGRLSFGGSTEPPREILREMCDGGGNSKTPARFKLFTSRFSMGSSSSNGGGGGHCLPSNHTRDELSAVQPRKAQKQQSRRLRQNLLAHVQRRNIQGRAAAAFCTSTPRKSHSNDQQGLICNSDVTENQVDVKYVPTVSGAANQSTPHLPANEFPVDARRLRLLVAPTSSSGSSSAVGTARRSSLGGARVRRRGARVSLCLHGNIFARSRPPTGHPSKAAKAEQQQNRQAKIKNKTRQQRYACFDQGRQLVGSDGDGDGHDDGGGGGGEQRVELEGDEEDSGHATYTLRQTNNNDYSLLNRNNKKNLKLGATMVMAPQHHHHQLEMTFNVSPRIRPQLQQFEKDHINDWINSQVTVAFDSIDDGGNAAVNDFEQLCRETVSTAPFALQPLNFSDGIGRNETEQEEQESDDHTHQLSVHTPINVQPSNNSNASSASCTIYSQGNVHSYRLPQINVMTVPQLSTSCQRATQNCIITVADLWGIWRRMSVTARLILGMMAIGLGLGGPLSVITTATIGSLLVLISYYYGGDK